MVVQGTLHVIMGLKLIVMILMGMLILARQKFVMELIITVLPELMKV